jgi:hypothetical protein
MHRRVRRTRVQFSKAWRGSPSSRSAVDDRQIESADALGVGQDIHLHDLVAGNRESDHGERSPVRPPRHDPDRAVHEDDLMDKPDWRTSRLAPPRPRPHGRRGTCRRSLRHRPAARYWDRARRPAARSRRRARLASWRAATGDRSTIGPISSNVMPNTSWSTNASRSGGSRVSSTTSSASPTESASIALIPDYRPY